MRKVVPLNAFACTTVTTVLVQHNCFPQMKTNHGSGEHIVKALALLTKELRELDKIPMGSPKIKVANISKSGVEEGAWEGAAP